MRKPSLSLPPGWHIPVVLILTFAIASPFQSMAWQYSSELRSSGHAGLAWYNMALGLALWPIVLVILLPKRNNDSGISLVAGLARFSLIVRYFLAFGVSTALLWLGILFQKISG